MLLNPLLLITLVVVCVLLTFQLRLQIKSKAAMEDAKIALEGETARLSAVIVSLEGRCKVADEKNDKLTQRQSRVGKAKEARFGLVYHTEDLLCLGLAPTCNHCGSSAVLSPLPYDPAGEFDSWEFEDRFVFKCPDNNSEPRGEDYFVVITSNGEDRTVARTENRSEYRCGGCEKCLVKPEAGMCKPTAKEE